MPLTNELKSAYERLPKTDDPTPIPQQNEKEEWIYWSIDGKFYNNVNIPHYYFGDDPNDFYWHKWRSRWCKSYLWHMPHPESGECIFCGYKGPFE